MENKLPETLPWKGATDPIWPVTYLLLKRNVKGYPFPDKLQKDKAKELVDRLTPFFSGLLPPPFLLTKRSGFLSILFSMKGLRSMARRAPLPSMQRGIALP